MPGEPPSPQPGRRRPKRPVVSGPAAEGDMRGPLRVAVAALSLLGLLGGCLILVHGGFETSGRRGAWPVFVPLPLAYLLVGLMLAQSGLALLWLLRQARWRTRAQVGAGLGWLASVWGLTALLRWMVG